MFNPEVHAHLLALGFAHTHYDADYEDTGCGETGPMLRGHPGYDEYESPDWRVIVSHLGRVEVSEARDLEFEAWVDQQASYWSGPAEFC